MPKKSVLEVLKLICRVFYPHPINEENKWYSNIDMLCVELQECLNWWQKRQFRKWNDRNKELNVQKYIERHKKEVM